MFRTGVYNLVQTKTGKGIALLLLALTATNYTMAEGATSVPKPSSFSDPMVFIMVIIMLILLLVIGLLANVLLGAAGYYYEKQKQQQQEAAVKSVQPDTVIPVFIGLLLFSSPLFAQDANVAANTVVNSFGSLSPTAFYTMTGVIVIELLVLFVLLFQLRIFLAKGKALQAADAVIAAPKPKGPSLWEKMNKFRPVEQEAQIDLGHDYDGIRELDNRLPPWWLYGFYVSIVFAGIYLWRHHVSHTAPSSQEELAIDMQIAAEQQEAYLKKAANSVDENTVQLVTDAALLANGEKVFIQNCAPCHGKAAEGVVGPNLTDDYWLHGGGIKDIFKTIKYGWPDKGMKSWKEDLSPAQIAQVASFIKHLKGTNPPNAKEKQGELYTEAVTVPEASPKDSVVTATSGK